MTADPAVALPGGDLADLIHLDDIDFLMSDPYPLYARLRNEAPVYLYAPLRTWVLTRYDDIRYVSRTPAIFTVTQGTLLHDFRYQPEMTHDFFVAEHIYMVDPPRHGEIRRLIAPAFSPAATRALAGAVEEMARVAFDEITPGEPYDWFGRAARHLPARMAAVFLGLPTDDDTIEMLLTHTDELEKISHGLSPESAAEALKNLAPMVDYVTEAIRAQHAARSPGLLGDLVGMVDEGRTDDRIVHMLTQTLSLAGNDTTTATLVALVDTFAAHPDQYALVRADRSLIPQAVEEVIRWWPPDRGFGRTAVVDTVVGDQPIAAGDHVYMAFQGGNRDPDAFDDPERFDVTLERRAQNLTFSYGNHICIGAPLVRLLARAVLAEMVERFDSLAVDGEPARVRSMLRRSWTSYHAVFS